MICILDPTGFVDIDGKLQPGKNAFEFSRKKSSSGGVGSSMYIKKTRKPNWGGLNILFAPLYRFPFEFVVELVGKLVLGSSSSKS